MSRGDVILRLVRISKTYYGMKDVKALKKITASFKRGEFVAIVGRSGSGKSTLINILGGLDRPTEGDYYCEGNNVARINEQHWDALRNKKIGFIFQNYFLIEYLSVYKNVEIALQFQNVPKGMKDAKIKKILEDVGLLEHMNKLPQQLSGGQRQRVAIARALVKDPDIILADEPTGGLDYKTADDVVKLLKGHAEDRLVIMVTHDRNIANKYATRIIELDQGYFMLDLIKENIEHTYQNVFRKIKPVPLRFKDKLNMTTKKIRLHFFKHLSIAFSLALIFSLSIISNGVNRKVNKSYHDYYETLKETNSHVVSISYEDEPIKKDDILSFNRIISTIDSSNFYTGYSKDILFINEEPQKVTKDNFHPDLMDFTNYRLIPDEDIEFEKLFYESSVYPSNDKTVMVTSLFLKQYYQIDDVLAYIGTEIPLTNYRFYEKESIPNMEIILRRIYFNELGELEYKERISEGSKLYPLQFSSINIPAYCEKLDELQNTYADFCDEKIENNFIFDSHEEYREYLNRIKKIITEIDESFFEQLFLSNGIVYFEEHVTNEMIKKIYETIYQYIMMNNIELPKNVFLDTSTTTNYTITAIIDNPYSSQIYLTEDNYNQLFINDNNKIELAKSFYTLKSDAFLFINTGLQLTNPDHFELRGSCPIVVIDDSKVNKDSNLKDIFYYINYEACQEKGGIPNYLGLINRMFTLFFYGLIVIAVVFYTMLINLVFKARINEIGIFRSVGSTTKDVKRLFIYEAVYLFTLTMGLSFMFIIGFDYLFNFLFFRMNSTTSNIYKFADIHLLIMNHTITEVSFLNLIIQSILVFAIILYISGKTISKIVNTNPMEILRGDDII